MFRFEINHIHGRARLGTLHTAHGIVRTPVFMPCGTAGTVKGVTPEQLHACGVQMLLGNTYHLLLRPGPEAVAALGGLHRLMAWDGPILTDSGGYQVFSLAHRRKLSAGGVVFHSHIDGSMIELTPESCMAAQAALGSDVAMQLDECPPAGAERAAVLAAVQRSADWAARCKLAWQGLLGRPTGQPGGAINPHQVLFGIQQGGIHLDLRRQSAERIVELDLPGYAVGGLSVGEERPAMQAVLDEIDGLLPRHKPRYLMGVGEPIDLVAGVLRGVDMFDCVLPTRNGRNAEAFTWSGRLRLRNACHARDPRPLDEACPCYACRHFSRGALRHYFMAGEMLGPTLATMHNLTFFAQFMAAIRAAIAAGELEARSAEWLARMYAE